MAQKRGHISEDELKAVKLAGYDDAEVIEVVQHVALNTWTNYINEVAKTEIDFPVVTTLAAARRKFRTRAVTGARPVAFEGRLASGDENFTGSCIFQ